MLHFKKRIKTDNSYSHSYKLNSYRVIVNTAMVAIEAEIAITAIEITIIILSRGHACIYTVKYTNSLNIATFICATEMLDSKKI